MKDPRQTEPSPPATSSHGDGDAVWQLLAKCPPKQAPPWFVSKTVRAVRSQPQRTGFFSRASLGFAVPALASLAVAAALIVWRALELPLKPRLTEESGSTELLREELHLMTYVDELLTVSDPATLDDAGLAELF